MAQKKTPERSTLTPEELDQTHELVGGALVERKKTKAPEPTSAGAEASDKTEAKS